jgi:hypothetical protein
MEELDNRPYWGYFVSHLKDSMGVGSLYTPEVFRHHCFITVKLDKTYNWLCLGQLSNLITQLLQPVLSLK